MVHKTGKISFYHYTDDGGDAKTKIPKGLTNVSDVSAGPYHVLALKSNGTVVAWGKDQMGNTLVPKGLTNVVDVAAGWSVSVALRKDGTAVAWGSGMKTDKMQVAPYKDIVAVSAGANEIYLLRSDGSVVKWLEDKYAAHIESTKLSAVSRYSEDGLLGMSQDGSVVRPDMMSTVPFIPAEGTTSIASLSANDNDYLAVKEDGTVVSWAKFWPYEPRLAKAPKTATGIAEVSISRDDHALALKKDGTVIAWGNNDYGQSNVPSDLRNVKAIAAGYEYSLALTAQGTVVGWGNKKFGNTDIPKELTDVIAIAAGGPNLALKKDGTVVAWGYNAKSLPLQMPAAVALASDDEYSAVLHDDHTITLWDEFNHVTRITALQNSKNAITSISSGYFTELWVLLDNGTAIAYDWRTGIEVKRYENTGLKQIIRNMGVTQNGDTVKLGLDDYSSLVSLKKLNAIKYLFVNENVRFIVGKDNRITIQGYADYLYNLPGDIQNIAKYSVSNSHGLALTTQGKAVGWGGVNGMHINGDLTYRPEAKIPSSLGAVKDIVAGNDFSMVLTKDGEVKVWGTYPPEVKKVPANAVNVEAISAGTYHAVALKKDGTVVEWGDSDREKMPKGLSNVKAIAATGSETMVLKNDGTVECWGVYCDSPTNIKNAISITGANGHFVIYCKDGTIIDYGGYYYPSKITNVDKIFPLSKGTLVTKKDGSTVIWGTGIPFKP
nr:hypothetical protein [Paenibacillus sp. NEAU-GSW1]